MIILLSDLVRQTGGVPSWYSAAWGEIVIEMIWTIEVLALVIMTLAQWLGQLAWVMCWWTPCNYL